MIKSLANLSSKPSLLADQSQHLFSVVSEDELSNYLIALLRSSCVSTAITSSSWRVIYIQTSTTIRLIDVRKDDLTEPELGAGKAIIDDN